MISPALDVSSLPDVFVARQPIFDQRSNLFGYELLFRSSLENHFAGTDHEHASVSVIANSFFVLGIEALTGRGRAWKLDSTRSLQLGMTARHNFVLPESAADNVSSSADSRPPPAGIHRAMRVSAIALLFKRSTM